MATRTVTVLFTDLVGSTELLSRVGADRAEGLRVEHFSLLRDAVAAHDGREVKNLGDGLMVAFDGVRAALDAAVAMQQGLDVRNRSAKEPLLVRIGVAMGEADVDGDDFFGVPVVEASRLCDTAVGGQILTTDLVRTLAGNRGDHTFEALGAVELRGLDTRVDAHEVAWEPLTGAAAGGIELPARLARRTDAIFVGRSGERATLHEALDAVEREPVRRVVLISGEPGIGKTTLVSEFASDAHDSGVLVTYGRCEEDLSVPYQPWREALGHLVDQGIVGPSAVDLLLDDEGTTSDGDGEMGRHRLYRSVVTALAAASESQRVLVVLDDLHWAEAQTVALLRQVAASTDPARLVVIATFRDAEITSDHPLADTLAALHREDGVARVSLAGLDDGEVLAMLEALAGHEMEAPGLELRDALRAETGGNPFFTVEILRHLSETGAIVEDETGRWVGTPDFVEHGLPVSVREVIDRRVARFDEQTQRLLRTASVIGRDFDVELLATVTDTDVDDVLDRLESVEAGGLILGIGDDRFTFVHALIGHTLYEGLSVTRRERIHRAIGEHLEAKLGDDPGPRAAELARHWGAAGRREAARAAGNALEAGDYALARFAPSEAQRWYRAGLERLDDASAEESPMRASLLAGLGETQQQLGEPAYRETLVLAGGIAEREGDTDTLVRAALATNTSVTTNIGSVAEDVVHLLERAIAAVEGEGSVREAKLVACLATEVVYDEDPGRAAVLAATAMEIARSTGDDATIAWTGIRCCVAALGPYHLDQRSAWARESLEAADRLGDPLLQLVGLQRVASSAMARCDIATADALLPRMAPLASTMTLPTASWLTNNAMCLRLLVAGDPDDVEQILDGMFAITYEAGDVVLVNFMLFMMVREQQGRTTEISDIVEGAMATNPELPAFRIGAAYMFLRDGRRDEAERLVADDLADGFSILRLDGTWTQVISAAAEIVHDLDHVDAARILYDRMEPFAEQLALSAAVAYEVLHFRLGLLAATLRREEDADRHFARAEEIHASIGAKYFLAQTRWRWAEVLAKRDDPDDLAKARRLAESAHAASVEHGYARIERHAAELLDTMRS